MTHYLCLAIPQSHAMRGQELSIASWMGTALHPEGSASDRADLIFQRRTVLQKREEMQDKNAYDAHTDQFKRLQVPIGVSGEFIRLPMYFTNWAVDAQVWSQVQEAIPQFSFFDLYYWLIPLSGDGPIETNHPRISSRDPKEIRQLLISEFAQGGGGSGGGSR